MNKFLACPILLTVFAVYGCAGYSGNIKTAYLPDEQSVSGTFTAVLFGARYSEDIETVAFLDLEGDAYLLEPYAPVYDFMMKKNITAQDALHEAMSFVNWHHAYSHTQIKKIMNNRGEILGYEIRPLYRPLRYGVSDVLNINYSLKEQTVSIFIRLKPIIEKNRDRDKFHNDD